MTSLTYRDAGVDLAAAEAVPHALAPLLDRTRNSGVLDLAGSFAAGFAVPGDPERVLVSSTDGVGTKVKLAAQFDGLDTIGIDLVAMCVNDVATSGAQPLFFLDYVACGELDADRIARIVSGVSEGCAEAGCALVGGETAEMPGVYAFGDFDLAGFAVGLAERSGLPQPGTCQPGDMLVGIASSGVHSNGYSFVRAAVASAGIDLREAATWSQRSLADELLVPTRIYTRAASVLVRATQVRFLAHITGGGMTQNITRVLPPGIAAVIDAGSWDVPPVFPWLRTISGATDAEMLDVFNMGIGFVAAVPARNVKQAVDVLADLGEIAWIIGELAADADGGVRWI